MKKAEGQAISKSPEEIKQRALESIKDPKLQKLFENILEKTTIGVEALQTAEELKNGVPTDAKAGGTQIMAILALLNNKDKRSEATADGKDTYTYKGNNTFINMYISVQRAFPS